MERVLAMILSSMVAVSMLPTFAFAAEEDVDESSGGQVQTESVSEEAHAVSDNENENLYNCYYYDDDSEMEWEFDIINGNAIITGGHSMFEGVSSTVAIPSTVSSDEYNRSASVTEIAEDANIRLTGYDSSCSKLIIPASITSIGKNALLCWQSSDTDLLVDCQCGSAGEKWALENRCYTTNGVVKNVTTKAGFNKKGSVTTTCKKCGACGIHTIAAVDFVSMNSTGYLNSTREYTGKNFTPYLEVADTNPRHFNDSSANLTEGIDYTLSGPSTVKNIGTYKYTITLKGWYSGTKKFSLTVVPKTTYIKKLSKGKKSFTVKWKKQTSQTTGYQIRYSTSKSMKKAKTVTVKGNKKTSKKIKNLKKKKTYYVQVRTYKIVKGKKYACSWDLGTGLKKVKTK